MAKWVCVNCEKSIVTNKTADIPKYCCYCGSQNICDEKTAIEKLGAIPKTRERLKVISDELNILYEKVKPLNEEYMDLLKEIRMIRTKYRTLIPQEEYVKMVNQVKCHQFRRELKDDGGGIDV